MYTQHYTPLAGPVAMMFQLCIYILCFSMIFSLTIQAW